MAFAKTVVAGVACLGLLAACSSSGGSSGPSSSSQAGTSGGSATTVDVKGYSFAPGDITVAKGATVTWKFEDSTKHNVTASDNSFKSTDLQSGSYAHTFNTAGKYSYVCTIHQFMKGTVTVK